MTRPWLLYLYLCALLCPLTLSSSQGLFLAPRVLDDGDSFVNTSNYPEDDYKFDNITTELEYINLLMVGINIIGGDWKSLTNSSLRNLTNSQGLALLNYYIGDSFDSNEIKTAFQFDLNLFDGLFVDQGSVRVSFFEYIPWITTNNYSSVDSILTLQNTTIYLATPDSMASMQSERCNANVTIMFINTTTNGSFMATGEPDADQNALGLQFIVESDPCLLYFNTSILSLGKAIDQTPALVYTLCMSAAALIQCIVCQYLTNGLEEGSINVRKVSLGTIRLLNSFDFYLCLTNLGRFMDNSLIVGFTAVPYAVLSLHFEFKLIVVVVTLQSRLAAMDVSKLNFSNVFWLFLSMTAVVISGVYGKPIFIYFAFAISQVPQIIQNFVLQQRHRWHCCLLLPLTLPKIGYLAYMLASDENIFMTTPHPALFVTIVVFIMIQLAVLLVQTRRSTLCKKEEVFYKFYDATDKECSVQDVCCICLEKLSANVQQDTKQPQDSKEASFLSTSTEVSTASSTRKQTIVSPPCKHAFHEDCLKEWIKQKHECPYCRCSLPYMPGEDDE